MEYNRLEHSNEPLHFKFFGRTSLDVGNFITPSQEIEVVQIKVKPLTVNKPKSNSKNNKGFEKLKKPSIERETRER